MKKRLIALLALSLVSVLTFASSNNEQKSADGKTTLSIFIGEAMPDYPENGTIVGDAISEIANVNYNFEFLVGELATRTGIMLAAGDYPDIINARGEQPRFKDADALIPLNDLITQYAPNLKALIGDTYWEALKEDDGQIYIIPDLIPHGKNVYTDADKAWYIQKAVLKDAGWPVVKTFDQYWTLIENYKEMHPTINGESTIGFEPLTYDWYRDYLYNGACNLSGGYEDNPIVEKINGKWTAVRLDGSDDDYKYLKTLNEKYNKDLLDPEGFVMDLDQWQAKIGTGRVLGISGEYWFMNVAQERLKDENPDRIFVGLPLTWDGGPDQYSPIKALAIGLGTSITTSCKDPIAAIKFLDTLAREDIQVLGTWGVEGENYTKEADGEFTMTLEQKDQFDENGDWFFPVYGGKYFYEFLPSGDGTFDNGNPTRYGQSPKVFQTGLEETEREVLEAYNIKTFNDMFSPSNQEREMYSPLWSLEPVGGTDEDLILTKFNDLRGKYCALLITAEPDEFQNIWDEWRNQISDKEIQIKLDFYQKGIDNRLKAYGIDNK